MGKEGLCKFFFFFFVNPFFKKIRKNQDLALTSSPDYEVFMVKLDKNVIP